MKEAIYIPAYSDGLMSMFFSKDDKQIAKENQQILIRRSL